MTQETDPTAYPTVSQYSQLEGKVQLPRGIKSRDDHVKYQIRFRGAWPVRQDYKIEGSCLKGSGEVQKLYFPVSTPEILQDFQRLNAAMDQPGEEAAFLSFARRWGHLGYLELHPDEQGLRDDLGLLKVTSEPLVWVKEHLRSVRGVVECLESTRNIGVNESLNDLLASPLPVVTETFGHGALSVNFLPDTGMDGVLDVLATVIDGHLSGIHNVVRPNYGTGKLEFGTTFRALIELIWWHVLRLAGEPILKVCRECHSVFAATRANQDYCPAPSYSIGSQSLCASRYRTRRTREKKMENQGGADERQHS